MEKRFQVAHQFKYSVVHNLIGKVNKHVKLWLQLDSMVLRMLLSATVLEVSLIRSFYFSNFANSSECKWLSAFTGMFPSSTAGLHLVLNTSHKKITFSPLSYGRLFSCDNNDHAKDLSCEQHWIILPSRNKLFPQNLFEFLHILESLVSRSSGLDLPDLRLDCRTFQASRLEARVSSFEVSTYFWAVL